MAYCSGAQLPLRLGTVDACSALRRRMTPARQYIDLHDLRHSLEQRRPHTAVQVTAKVLLIVWNEFQPQQSDLGARVYDVLLKLGLIKVMIF